MKLRTDLILALVLASINALATPVAIRSGQYLELDDFTGNSFLQTMITPEAGIVAKFDEDYTDTYEFGSWEQINYAIDNFDRKNKNRVLGMFDFDRSKLRQFAEKLRREERTFRPSDVSEKVGRVMYRMRIRGDKYSLGQFFAIASGAGTLIRIDEDNYFYNIGYFAPEVRSGRSYGATNRHNANDASHLMYLRELESFLTEGKAIRLFYLGIMKFLVDTDVSVYDEPRFNDHAKAVLTDYITVYTAELRRHLMKDLHPYRAPWGNDMTEATFLSLFNVESGLMMLEDGLVESSIKEHWALSRTGSGRSGFGINRWSRRALQRDISNHLRYHDEREVREVVRKVDELVGKRSDGDVYRAVMEFLNNRRNLSDAERVEAIDHALPEAFVDFLMLVKARTREMVSAFR